MTELATIIKNNLTTKSAGDVPENPFYETTDQIVITVFHSIAFILTLYRLAHRIRIRRFSWDDGWALFALGLDITYYANYWTELRLVQHRFSLPDEEYKKRLLTAIRGISLVFTALVWACRVSMSLSIARILPPGHLRTFAIVVSILCVLQGVILVSVKSTFCRITYNTQGKPVPSCSLAINPSGVSTIAISEIITDIVTTVTLVILPLRVLWYADLVRRERRLVLSLFTATLLTLAVCIIHAVFVLQHDLYSSIYASLFESAISLMFCNLAIVVTSVYGIFFRSDDDHSDEETMSSTSGESRTSRSEENTLTFTNLSITDLYTSSPPTNNYSSSKEHS